MKMPLSDPGLFDTVAGLPFVLRRGEEYLLTRIVGSSSATVERDMLGRKSLPDCSSWREPTGR